MEKLLVNKNLLLKKFPGKGGWTYAIIPEITTHKNTPFGWVKVRGKIDEFEIKDYHLMPLGNGNLFLPVKAEIRRKIGKKEGDHVHVILYEDNSPIEIPEELHLCLVDEPQAYETFLSYNQREQKSFIDWIYSAKKDETRIKRIADSINKLINKQKL